MKDTIKKFIDNKDIDKSTKMRKYMRDNFEFLGIDSTTRKSIQKEFLITMHKEEDINNVLLLQLWSYKEREFQYLALDYLIKEKKKLKKEDINLLETLILTKPWWDTVDLIASHLVGELVLKYPELIEQYIIPWSENANIWLRRTAILHSLKYKENTDKELLNNIIKANSEHKDFFIRKAIGWTLREYSKTNKEWVKEFIGNNKLSSLSIKEGSKYLD